ncbi:MAG TPA: CBS domain-containing protein [Phycisphaerales bacterium]|nr:CBS domain-containing protein [Phycisphaerales bacterium]
MATSQTEVKSQAIELSTEAFETFCDDISGMFGVDMECSRQKVCAETIEGLKKRFRKLVAVNSVKAEGALGGTFQLVFDQEGLFTLAGVIVMLPEKRILENRKRGSAKEGEDMSDALAEAGNMLVGSWDRVFRERLDGHGHFAQTSTFIGNPWDKPEEKIGLAGDEEFVFVPYEMTIASYPAFNCGVIFPKTIFDGTFESESEQADPAEEEAQEKTEEKAQEQRVTAEKTDSEEPNTAPKGDSEKTKPQEPAVEKASIEKPAAEENNAEAAAKTKSKDIDTDVSDSAVEEKEVTTDGSKEQPVSETIRKIARSPAVLPGEPVCPATAENPAPGNTSVSLAICAKDIMQKDVVWAGPDDSVQQALTKMQQADAGFMMIGRDEVLEGVVSKSDITAAVSIYLRPVFAKWRRPLDDATLQIKAKWIMSRPVHSIKPDTLLVAIMENMCQLGRRALPVVDQHGKVQGLVTVFDIFKALLNSDEDISIVGKTLQAPALV